MRLGATLGGEVILEIDPAVPTHGLEPLRRFLNISVVRSVQYTIDLLGRPLDDIPSRFDQS